MKTLIILLLTAMLTLPCSEANSQTIPAFYSRIDSLYAQNKFHACMALEAQVAAFIQQRNDTLGNNAMVYLADSYYQTRNIDKAIEWREKQHAYLAQASLQDELSIALFNLGNLYLEAGAYPRASKIADELLMVDKKLFGEASPDYVTAVINAVDFYLKSDRLADAQALLKYHTQKNKKTSFEYGLLMNKLGDLYTYTGEYSLALNALTDALGVFKKDSSATAKQFYSSALANLGILFMEQGKVPEAVEQFSKVLEESKVDSSTYYAIINNLATASQRLGQYEVAEKLLLEVAANDKAHGGETHPNYALTLNSLGNVYSDQGKFDEAEKAILRAMEIQRSNDGALSISYASKANLLGYIYVHSGNPLKAIPIYLNVLEIVKNKLGEESFPYSTTAFNLGFAYLRLGRGLEGIKLIRESATTRAKILGKRHPKYAESLEKIAEYQWQRGQQKSARATFGEVFDNYSFQIETFFPVLSEEEKAKFYYTLVKPTFDKFNSFVLDFYRTNPAVAGDQYNLQVQTKAVVMLATEKVKNAILSSRQPALVEKYVAWKALKEKIAKLYAQNENPAKTDSLVVVANGMEKELARASAAFLNQIEKKKVTWREVQKSLKPNEAAIEVVRFNVFNPADGGRFDNQVNYAFLVVTPQTKYHPDLILMEDGNDMENRSLKFYRNSVQLKLEDNFSYSTYFESIDDYLNKGGITKFYFSPDGVYNQINLNTLFDPEVGQFLNEKYSIIQVTNTSELVDSSVKGSKSTSAILMGFPNFAKADRAKTSDDGLATETNEPELLSRGLRGSLARYAGSSQGIPPLPGTEKEILELSRLFKRGAESYLADGASEANAKKVKNPKVLHIATHGFFLEDEPKDLFEAGNKYIANPLLQSGLLLAGAENFIKTGVLTDSTGEDGILTAYEVMNLSLDQTDLVVLSACETARGEVKNGEGVYGLQRALKLSGSKCIVMSLWSVDDEATLELMKLFYEDFLLSNDAHEAMRKAQKKLKQTYPSPFYWGAFVVIGI